jgi:hypothetical protein
MTITDILTLLGVLGLFVFIVGSAWEGVKGEIDYRRECQHYYLNDMYDHQMSMTCTKCGNQAILSTDRANSRTNHTRSN